MSEPLEVGSSSTRGPGPAIDRQSRRRKKYLSVIVPTRNERDNIEPLLSGLERALSYLPVEVIFVDDSDDGTADRVREVAQEFSISARVIARPPQGRVGGLGGAVVEGFGAATGEWLCVMDGDLQHPPDLVPQLLKSALGGEYDLVLGSRLTAGASAEALGPVRYLISRILALFSRLCFPRCLRRVTDPMSGFFVVRRSSIDLEQLRPKGFKILLEILVRFPDLKVAELPFRFALRNAGQTKAGMREIVRLAALFVHLKLASGKRFRRFVTVGASGFVVNNLLLAVFTEVTGFHYLLSAALATQGSSLWNFSWSSRWVFSDRQARGTRLQPLAMFLLMNNAALALRAPMMFLLTSGLGVHYVLSNIVSIAVLAIVRYTLADRWIWSQSRPRLHTYDLHGIMRLASDAELPELEAFRRPVPEDQIDLRVHVGGDGRRPDNVAKSGPSIRYHEGLGALGFGMQIEAGERIEVWASSLLRYSPHVLYTNIVEPILRWALVTRGYALVHGACVAYGEKAFLVTARSDTGKTTTMLKLLKNLRAGAFLADDLTLVTPEGRAYTYPKPLTISRHTVRAIDARTLTLAERTALGVQSKVHSRSGRRTAKFMTRLSLPMATVNAIAQWLVPPPKYPVRRLIPDVSSRSDAQLEGMFVIERHAEGEEALQPEDAVSVLLSNCEDAYGFPPYDAIEGFLCSLNGSDLRAREQQIVRAAFRSCPAILLRSKSYAWAERIEALISGGRFQRGVVHRTPKRIEPRALPFSDPAAC